jgi:ATP-dependent Clp protease, protease subunit
MNNTIITDKIVKPIEDLLWITTFNEEDAKKFSESVFKIAGRDEHEPIIVYVDSYGGYVDVLSAMLSVMDSVPNPFVTIATGKAMSAGAVLLSHGDIRCIGPYARVMIHETSSGAGGHIRDVKNDIDENLRMNEEFLKVLARNCGKTLPQLKRVWKTRRDAYFTPTAAVKFGLADHIGIPIINKYSAFELDFHHAQPLKPTNKKK